MVTVLCEGWDGSPCLQRGNKVGWFPVCSDRADCGVFGGWPYLAYDFIKRLVCR